MQNDAASRGKGDGVNQAGKAGAVERILWVHQSGAFSGNLCGDLCFCIGLPIKLACNLAQQVYDPLLIRLLPQHLICDLLLQLLHRRRICAPHYFMWQQEIGVFNDTVHKQRDLLEQFTIADSHPQAAGSVAARPAFPDGPLGVDVPEHGRTALSAADTVADLPDALAFLSRLIPAPCAFDRDGFFVDVFVDDRLEFFIAGVLRILQYP